MESRRNRVWQAAIDEIKSIAWEEVNRKGISNVTISDITKRMGISPPAFYSYFKSREELLSSLIVESYKTFQKALTSARDSLPESDIAGMLYNMLIAWRHWGISNPNIFGLFSGRRIYGFKEREKKVLKEAEKSVEIFMDIFDKAWKKGLIKIHPLDLELPADYSKSLKKIQIKYKMDMPLEIVHLVLNTGMLMHGMISYEISGRHTDLVEDPFLFYQFHVLEALRKFGINYSPGY